MNSSSRSWASNHRKWRLCLKDGKAGTGVFYGFIAVILSNIWFGDSNENAGMLQLQHRVISDNNRRVHFGVVFPI
jgi:hypothetical protein